MGHEFVGWYLEETYLTKVESNTIVEMTSNHVLYAKWNGNTCTVNFNSLCGSTIASKNVIYGQPYGTLESPSKSGYIFDGCYNATDIGNITMNDNVGVAYMWDTIIEKVELNVTYTITMNSATLISGTSTTFDTVIYDFTKDCLMSDVVSIPFGNNVSYNITAFENIIQGNDVKIIVYAGNRGSTTGNNVSFNGIKLGTIGTTIAMKYVTDSIVTATEAHTLYAHWLSVIPTITYTGTYTTSNNAKYWYAYFKDSGTLTVDNDHTIDVFLVGGDGGYGNLNIGYAGSGGGGHGGQQYNGASWYVLPASGTANTGGGGGGGNGAASGGSGIVIIRGLID